jgi:GT2 family glycosyltransferase
MERDIQMNNAKVGFVVIGRNEGQRLELCLKSLPIGSHPVVYVDSNSYDDSVYIAKTLSVDVIVLDSNMKINASVARNSGFKYLIKNNNDIDYVHFIDADCELDVNWIEEAVTLLDCDETTVAVCGRLREKFVNKNVYTRLCDMSWYIKPGFVNSCGGIFTIRADVYQYHNGFNEDLIAGADPEFFNRVYNSNGKIMCLPALMGTHDCAMYSLKQWWIRSKKTGFAYANGKELGLWKNKPLSALFWGGVLPFTTLVISLFFMPFLLLFLIYIIQILRTANKLDIPYLFKEKFLYGSFIILGKVPDLIGVIKYYKNRLLKLDSKIIEYKAKR